MSSIELQDLLAPTWKCRVRAADALLGTLAVPSPEQLQAAVDRLLPSAAEFLPALIAFWTHVADRQYAARMGLPVPSAPRWGTVDLSVYPLDRSLDSLPVHTFAGLHVWALVGRLGSIAPVAEAPFLDCLEHPEPLVQDAMEWALGNLPELSDEAFARYLAVADRKGSNQAFAARSAGLARHARGLRLQSLLAGIQPGAGGSNAARLAALARLEPPEAQIVRPLLATWLHEEWQPHDLHLLMDAFAALYRGLSVPPASRMRLCALATSELSSHRMAAALWLGERADGGELALCVGLAADDDPVVRTLLCRGLARCQLPAREVLCATARHCLGNHDACDGEPHDACLAMLLQSGDRARLVVTELQDWWNAASASETIARDTLEDALRVCEALGREQAQGLLPGLQRTLAAWTSPGPADNDSEPVDQATLSFAEQSALAAAWQHELAREMASMQAQIDAMQAEAEAEQRANYPELFERAEVDETCEPAAEEYEDELTTRLRQVIAVLQGG